MGKKPVFGFMLMLIVVSAFNVNLAEPIPLGEAAERQRLASPEAATPTDLLIINDPHKHAYFGWHGASQMPSVTSVFGDDFEDGTLDSWEFNYSTNAAQNGSIAAGTWGSSIVSGGDALSGVFSSGLFAESVASVAPWQVDAAMHQVISKEGVTALKGVVQFDQITDPGVGGGGAAFFLIDVANALNVSESVSYGFDSDVSQTWGDISYDVSPGQLVNFEADVDTDYFGKYGDDLP
ncbi:MAG: hypothetical protein JSW72_00645, partial [Candidatus Bathyarchaeota archaeon]